MKMRSLACAGIVFGMAVTLLRAAPGAAPAKVPPELAKAKVAAARKTYEVIWKNNREGLVPFAELAYRWSKRWLEAEVDLRDKKDEQVAAYQAHKDRMRELARITRDRYRNRVNTIEEATATEFYNAEAEVWLEQAKNK
jgi:site-specific recombinase XerD